MTTYIEYKYPSSKSNAIVVDISVCRSSYIISQSRKDIMNEDNINFIKSSLL